MADNEHPPPGPPPAPGQAQAPEPWPGHQQAPGDQPAAGPPPGQAGPPALRRPDEPVPTSSAPPAIDPEQVRQFQQFQQFQELMRQQQEQGFPQGTPPPPGSLQPWGPPPRKRGPLWRRILRPVAAKVITVAVAALLLVAAFYWLVDKLPGSGPPESPGPPHVVGGGEAKTNLIFETNPRNAVQRIYDDIAQGDPTSACGRFTEEARAQFAQHFSGLGGSCEQIVEALRAQVTPGQKSEYANPRFPSWVNAYPTTDTVEVSSCAMTVTGGPRLGLLTVSKIDNSVGGQWIVTRHDPEPESCAGIPSTPPTT